MIFLNKKSVLITGGTGSFGKQFLKRLLLTKVSEIRVFSRDENKQDQMRSEIADHRVKYFIGDIRDLQSITKATINVDYIFHAAALKQVPSCEFHPLQAIQTNILGTNNVFSAARLNKVKKTILLSTDKAVYPVNAMGLSKALAEKIMVSESKIEYGSQQLCATRYGNVLGSRGSIIPRFIYQIKNKLPITITHQKMTRFLMTLEDSTDLVLYALEHGSAGQIMVQKAQSCYITDLAAALCELFKVPFKPSFIGVRHGEKLHETLISSEEMSSTEEKGNYFILKPDTRDINYESYFSEGQLDKKINLSYSSENKKLLNIEQIKELLLKVDEVKDSL